jgi:hypothetical protein
MKTNWTTQTFREGASRLTNYIITDIYNLLKIPKKGLTNKTDWLTTQLEVIFDFKA